MQAELDGRLVTFGAALITTLRIRVELFCASATYSFYRGCAL